MGVLPTLRKINNTITLDEIQKAFNQMELQMKY